MEPVSEQYINFEKWEGIGNDFVMLQAEPDENSSALAVRMCSRKFGIGADGLIYLYKRDGSLYMKIYNSDGSAANMCGNGIRCLAALACQEGLLKTQERTEIITDSGSRFVSVMNSEGWMAEVNMGRPVIEGVQDAVLSDGRVCRSVRVNMGNPHWAVFLPEDADLDAFDVCFEGRRLEESVEGGINVEFIKRISDSRLKMRVWERGCGETMACGTGACAVLAAAVCLNLSSDKCDIVLPGGILKISLPEKDGCIFMTGEARRVFAGKFFI